MTDLLAPLYRLPAPSELPTTVRVRVAMAYERHEVLRFVRATWSERWASEAALSFSGHPISCHVAITEGRLCGFACYDATFRGFFGPMGVTPAMQGAGIGRRLLLESLGAMRARGYAYAIIGNVEEARAFYEKAVGASPIEGSRPGAYEYDLHATEPPKAPDS